MATLAERFEMKVDRSGEHHVWQGSMKADGTGTLKVDGTVVTAQRVAWELANGPVPKGARVKACPATKSCVRPEHLALDGAVSKQPKARTPRQRTSWGGGSKREIRGGVWKLQVNTGRFADGRQRRENTTVYADTEAEANRELAGFVAEVHGSPRR